MSASLISVPTKERKISIRYWWRIVYLDNNITKRNIFQLEKMSLLMNILFNYFIGYVCCKTASEWRSRSIFQMDTDRFSPSNDPYIRCPENPMVEKSLRHYCGGIYRGAIDQVDYIVQLGFNALWISPIPLNIDKETIYGVGWHGYWQENIFQLNKYFGSEKDFIDFIAEAHQRDIWIILDLVANHLGQNLTGNYFPFNQSEYFHQPLCFVEDYSNQTQVNILKEKKKKKNYFI